MLKTERQICVKSALGRAKRVVRELYLRDDVPCQSKLCIAECNKLYDSQLPLLPEDLTHYLIPDCYVAREYLEILETPEFRGMIFTQTTVNSVQHEGSRRLHNRLKNIVKDPRKESVIFHNEFQKYIYSERQKGESIADWQIRMTYSTAVWYFHHLVEQKPVVMLTQNKQFIEEFGNKIVNVFIMTIEEYLKTFWSQIPGIMDLFDSLTAAIDTKNKDNDYSGYLPVDILESGIKSGRFIEGCLQVNKHNAMQEAFVKRTGDTLDNELSSDILISGMVSRNRAIHGDNVVVELLPKSEWTGRSLALLAPSAGGHGGDNEDVSSALPTGKIVGILQRNWREYVATFSEDEESQKSGKAGKVLVIPLDFRIPKIRISTSQVDSLRDHRIVVRIDSWATASQYPNGHFVRSLGKIGDLETEIAAILVENTIAVSQFSELQLKELPSDTPENPWKMDDEEIRRRRDLRDTHLIFSIDPKGCEDVDDTLSVRKLPNGNTELGVHIADVTYFVTPGLHSDIEASSRSTTVYLADRRYDMLPSVLSANLCSLISGVDRYAMSVIWELDSSYQAVDVWYGRTVIRSKYKLFYEIAQAMHDGIAVDQLVENIPELKDIGQDNLNLRIDELTNAVNTLMDIARHLKARRVKEGCLELESVEVRVEMDDRKKVEDLSPKEHQEIHETIAECMIFANHWVAKKIAETFTNQALLRHHPLPRKEGFVNLINCASAKGFDINTSSNKLLAQSLDNCVDHSDPNVNKLLRSLATQAMNNAEYFSTGSLPSAQFFHYGLALELYTHFTSPIRRYADILVHRQLMAAINDTETDNLLLSNKQLNELCQHINRKHRAAQFAQRESQELFQSLYFKDKDPADDCCIVDAIICVIRANGVLVYVPRYGIKGNVFLKDKEGQVIYIDGDGRREWTNGTVSRLDTLITVSCETGSHTYHLLDHITVDISLQQSRAHSSSLKLNLYSNKSLKSKSVESHSGKSSKSEIIKEVTETAEEKRNQFVLQDLGSNFTELQKLYGQSTEDSNLYNLFQSFKDSALLPR